MSADETRYIPGVNHQAVEEVWLDSGAKGSERLVLMSIARFLNVERKAWPSNATLERLTGLSESAISNCLGRLESAGRLKIKYRKNKRETNLYTLPPFRPTRETRDKLPSSSGQVQESKKKKMKSPIYNGSSTRETRGGTIPRGREGMGLVPQPDTSQSAGPEPDHPWQAMLLRLSCAFADAMIEHRGKKPRYREHDAESVESLDAVERLVEETQYVVLHEMRSAGTKVTTGKALALIEQRLSEVIDYVSTSDDDRWAQVKMPAELIGQLAQPSGACLLRLIHREAELDAA